MKPNKKTIAAMNEVKDDYTSYSSAKEALESIEYEVIYLIYTGISIDGRGYPKLKGWTDDKSYALKHQKECKNNPYSIGMIEEVRFINSDKKED